MKTLCLFIVILLFVGLCHGENIMTPCTERGRFPYDESNDCRGYVMCLMGGITKFTQYKLTCPQGSIYSHIEQLCTNATNYKCYPEFECSIASNFLNPLSKDCSSYISCVPGMNGLATPRLITCPQDTIFNETIGECFDRNLTDCYSFTASDSNDINNAVSNTVKVLPLLFIYMIYLIVV